MTAHYSFPEARLIHGARRRTASYRRGILAAKDLVRELVQALVLGDCDRVLLDCARQLPTEAYPELETYLSELAAKDYSEKVLLIGPGLSDEEQAALKPRFRAVVEQLAEFVRQPHDPADAPADEIDLFWTWLHDVPRQPGVRCRQEGCSEEAISLSAFCPAHHYLCVSQLKNLD